jgi:hypothetical protein
MRTWKRIAMILVVSIGLVGVIAAPAAASGPCGSACDFQDPSTFGNCAAGAITVGWAYHLELRYSPSCETTWARVDNSGILYTEVFLDSARPTGHWRTLGTIVYTSWTLMLDDHEYLNYACMKYMEWDGGPEYQVCTGAY